MVMLSTSNGPSGTLTPPKLQHSASTPSSSSNQQEFSVTPNSGLRSVGARSRKADKNEKYITTNGMHRPNRYLTPEEVAAGKKERWLELELTGSIRNLSPSLFSPKFKHLTNLFLNGNQLTRIPTQISQLCNLVMLDLSHNKLRSLPSELGDMISLCHLYLNYNQLRVLPYELGKLFRLHMLGLHGNPLAPELSHLYHENNGTQKLLLYLLDHLAIHTQPPPQRELVYVRRDFLNREQPIALVSVMCYNVLCDKYATTNLYSYCPSWALNWEYRKTAILKEIKSFDADVVTLQEVETEQYQKLFLPELEQLGYTGIFSPKSRAKTMQEEEKKYVDGCAVFWKVEKFELEREHLIEFTQIAIAKAEGSEHMLNRVMTRDNIGLVAVLKVKQNVYHNSMQLPPTPHENVVGNPLVVCTAHIHWDPEFCDVKLVQTMMLVNELAKVIEDVGRTFRIDPQHVSTLLCGDLNSLPDSGVFDYLTQSGVSADHPDFKEFRNSGMECLQSFSSSNSKTRYTHPLVLKSAYDKDSTVLPFTNYTLDFKGVIDYIMASPGLCKISVLGPLDPGWVQSNKIIGCPHPHVPSDHIPLYVQYAIVPPSVLQFRQQSEQQQQRQQQQQSSQQQQHQRNNSGMSQLQHFMQHGMSSNSQNGFAHTFGQLGSR